MFVKPGVNKHEPELLGHTLKVRIPHTHALLPEEGQEVPDDAHWTRLLRDGDVVLVQKRGDPEPQPHAEEGAPS